MVFMAAMCCFINCITSKKYFLTRWDSSSCWIFTDVTEEFAEVDQKLLVIPMVPGKMRYFATLYEFLHLVAFVNHYTIPIKFFHDENSIELLKNSRDLRTLPIYFNLLHCLYKPKFKYHRSQTERQVGSFWNVVLW